MCVESDLMFLPIVGKGFVPIPLDFERVRPQHKLRLADFGLTYDPEYKLSRVRNACNLNLGTMTPVLRQHFSPTGRLLGRVSRQATSCNFRQEKLRC
jgi:hypothetical protein